MFKRGPAFFRGPVESHSTGGGAVEPVEKSADIATAKIIFFDKKKPSLVPTREELAHLSNASDKKDGIAWPVIDDAAAAERIEKLREAHHSDVLLPKSAESAESVAIPVRGEAPSVDAVVVPAEPIVQDLVTPETGAVDEGASEWLGVKDGQVWKNDKGEAFVVQVVQTEGTLFPNLIFTEGDRVGTENLFTAKDFLEFVQNEKFVLVEGASDADIENQLEAIEDEIEQEIDEVSKMIKSHRKTVQMRAMNGWTHKEEWDKLTAALDQAKADTDAAIDLANGNGHEAEALDQLKKVKASLDISMLEVKVLPELEKEDVKAPAVEKKKKQGKGPEKKSEGKKKAVAKQEARESEEVMYERLERMAEEDGAYHTVLGAIAAGLRMMKEAVPGIEKRKDELAGRIAEAIALKLEHPIAATGERLGWSMDETALFAREIVRKGIEKFLK